MVHPLPLRIAGRIASLLDPVARLLAPQLPGISGAAVTLTSGGTEWAAYRDLAGWTVRAGYLCLEVDRTKGH